MGFLKKIASVALPAIGFAVGGPTGGAIGAGIGGMLGADEQNSAAQAASATQMQFQEYMSNSAYQRAMADMKKAGLNPILAYKQGGASTPSGSSFSPVNTATSAFSAAQAAAGIDNLIAQNDNIQTNSAYQKAQTSVSVENARRMRMENDAIGLLPPELRLLHMSTPELGAVSSLAGKAANSARSIGSRVLNFFKRFK